ncbi:uncharacterized protein [Chironomus tepperi]|uniref:uncharacterized protein n=1 Tax=Chironomus tepperi TaxID=113505 RepID=UPI00391F84AB
MNFDKVLLIIVNVIIFTECEIVKIEDGYLEGTVMTSRKGVDFHAFMGIPYAEPPVGNLRFQAPVQKQVWENVYNATAYSPACMQTFNSRFGRSEDCLYLNVFTRSLDVNATKPVIVFIHGGAFRSGSGGNHGPNQLLDRDVVLVTINYRLGAFGFLALGRPEATGNMGLKDQAMALKWVQRNIVYFGGDPNLVTLAGTSAGAHSSSAHLVSDMSAGLFHRLISLSGAITWQKGFESDGIASAVEMAVRLNCSTDVSEMFECFNEKTSEEINVAASFNFYTCPVMPWIPVIEPDFGQERFFLDDPNALIKSGNFARVPIFTGITTDEFISPVVTLLSNEDSLDQLNNNFTEFAPICFFFNATATTSVHQFAKTLKIYYLPFDTINNTAFNSLRLLNADGTIGYGVHRLVRYAAPYTDVFYYRFSFIGRFSIFNYPGSKPFGVHHGDDTQYYFTSGIMGPINEDDPENATVERLTRMWEQFAIHGNPNNPDDEFLAEMNWPKYDEENEYFLDIGNHLVEKQGLYLERYHVWDNMEKATDKSYHKKSFGMFTHRNLNMNATKPVIVFIHGGALFSGSGGGQGPNQLLDRDVVLVTINYRLGAFGFLALGTKEVTGNMGLKDQAMTLKWVQRNIVYFGGDPNLVTLAGGSAGAHSSSAHLVSDMSRGFFHRLISASGSITWQKGFDSKGIASAIEMAVRLNCSTNVSEMFKCFNQKTSQEINAAASLEFYTCPVMPWIPVIEPDFGQERFFLDDPNTLIKSGNFARVPILTGITSDEFFLPVATLLGNADSLEQLNNNFTEFASTCFFFDGTKSTSVDEFAKTLKNYYLPFGTINNTAFNSLKLLNADGTIGYGVHRLARFAAPYTDVFYYKFSFVGRFSIFNYPGSKPYGVHHGDDMQYYFSSSMMGPINEDDPENIIVERVTRMWEQFAIHGNPNNPDDEFLAEMNWPKYDTENEYFLDIGNHLVEKQGLYLERYHVWDRMENGASSTILSFSIMVLIKNLFNPEKESIENAFALANGGLCTVVYFVTIIIKKQKFVDFLEFLKSQKKFLVNEDYIKLMTAAGREYKLIITALLYILPVGIAVRFFQLPIEYGYIQLFEENQTFIMPPSMGIPTSVFGELPTFVLESLVRTAMLSMIIGICTIFILSTLYICTQFNILATELENVHEGDEKVIDKVIERHQELLNYTKLLNEIYAPYFFANCLFSFLNTSILLFSFLTHNVKITNYIVEVPLATVGISQLFFVLFFGDRLIETTSKISIAAYNSEWYTMPVKIQKKILFVIMRAYKLQSINVGGKDVMVASMLLFSQNILWSKPWNFSFENYSKELNCSIRLKLSSVSDRMRMNIAIISVLSIIVNSKCEIIEIEDGKLEGTFMETRKGVKFHAFLKIPYAEPPIDNLRFQPPVQNQKWEEVLNATSYGPICMQYLYDSEYGESEDCLHLNVFTKSVGSANGLKPVIVYIHGGGFEYGTGSSNGPNYLMDRDVVLITINYRLGPFGFLALGTKEVPGNMGLKDQVMALKWIQRNIVHFGGDPNQVTIAGLSAGGYSTTAHMASSMSKELFHQVIALSGAITWQKGLRNNGINEAIGLAKRLNCSSDLSELFNCINQKSSEEIIMASKVKFHGCPIMPWIPVIEPDFGQERFLIEDPNESFKNGNFSRVPVIIGITADEFIEPVVSLLNDEESLKLLNGNFIEIGPTCFFFDGTNRKTVEEVAKILRNYYLPFEKIDKRAFNSLQLLTADATIGYSVHRFVHYVSKFTDVYYYKFSYSGRFSIFNYPRDKPYGVHHIDDNQYLFYNSYLGPIITESDPENFIVERMTRIWEQFAKKGNPNNPDDEFLADMIWPKHTLEDEYFLDIGSNMVEKQGLYLERYYVWDSLENGTTGIMLSINVLITNLTIIYKLIL